MRSLGHCTCAELRGMTKYKGGDRLALMVSAIVANRVQGQSQWHRASVTICKQGPAKRSPSHPYCTPGTPCFLHDWMRTGPEPTANSADLPTVVGFNRSSQKHSWNRLGMRAPHIMQVGVEVHKQRSGPSHLT